MPGGDAAPLAHGRQHWLKLGGAGGAPEPGPKLEVHCGIHSAAGGGVPGTPM